MRVVGKLSILFILTLATVVTISHGLCSQPQKAIYISLHSISHRDHMQNLFTVISNKVSAYSLSFHDNHTQNNYRLYSIKYQLAYNNHYQRQLRLTNNTVRVELGVVTLLAEVRYNITDKDGHTLYEGGLNARSYLDPSSFDKQIVHVNDSMEWGASNIKKIMFNALWVVQPTKDIPQSESHMIESIMNGVVNVYDFKQQLANQINTLFRLNIFNYLNTNPLFKAARIDYTYSSVKLPIDHYLKSSQISQSSNGLVAFINFGLNDKQQGSCGSVPETFREEDYGGVVQYITMSSVKFIVVEALNRGLFDVMMDDSWETDTFQLFMGDLGNAVPHADQFPSTDQILINCKVNNVSKVVVSQFDDRHIYLEVPQKCYVSYKAREILQVTLQLIAIAEVTAKNDVLLVELSDFYPRKIHYTPLQPGYAVERQDVAEMMITSILNKLTKSKTFGSQLPLVYRRYPAVIINAQHLIIFDYSETNGKYGKDKNKAL